MMKKKLDIAFVVLHYKNLDETVNCVDNLMSLKLNTGTARYIVIVCNGSHNGSDEYIENKYKGTDSVIVIRSEENLGFARGNNLGFAYAKQSLKCDFTVMLNSDVEILTDYLDEAINEAYGKYGFGVLGPDVINLRGAHCNPVDDCPKTKADLDKRIRKAKKRLFCCRTGFEYIYCSANRIMKKIRKDTKDRSTAQTGCAVHGCCMIFSRKYADRFDGLCDKTFLYGEEEILQYICKREEIKTIYYPKIKVLHKEAVSTKSDIKSILKRHKFYYENVLNSYNAFRLVMDEYNREV